MSDDGMPTRADGAYVSKPDPRRGGPRGDINDRIAEDWTPEPERRRIDPLPPTRTASASQADMLKRLDDLEYFVGSLVRRDPTLRDMYNEAFADET